VRLALDFEAATSILITAFSKTHQALKLVSDHSGFSAARDSLIKT
jgi:hypothetical protein